MFGINASDGDNVIDWGRTSHDYSVFRPGPPPSFYHRLAALGVGLPGQNMLDLGTGTGVLARQFARQGANATGVDISPEQIEMANSLSEQEGLAATFLAHSAEALPWREPRFDIVTANQCWLYFDRQKVIGELRRVLKPGGMLATSHLCWLPRVDEIARRSEGLVLKFNPSWSAVDWPGEIPACPGWAKDDFRLRGMFYYDEPVAFTHETWCGRIRACRGVGASMSPEQVAAFDAAHRELLEATAPPEFTVLHRIDFHLFEFKNA